MSDLGESIYADMTVLYRDLDQNSAEPESARDTLARFYKTADIERDGTSLKFQPMRRKSAEFPNLEFRKDNFQLATIEEADLIRLGNVLLPEYYSRQEAVAALHSFGSKLREGGRIVLGSGATFTLTYEKKGGEILPLRATVKIIEGQPPHYSGLTMPGTKGLRHVVQEALDSLPIFEIDLGAPMGITRAEKIRKLIEAKGYRVEAVFDFATWLEIDLTGRE
jgi:hypothetical protein